MHVDDPSTQMDCWTARRYESISPKSTSKTEMKHKNDKKVQGAGLGCGRNRSGGGRTGTAGSRTHRGRRSAGWVRALRVLDEEDGGRGHCGDLEVGKAERVGDSRAKTFRAESDVRPTDASGFCASCACLSATSSIAKRHVPLDTSRIQCNLAIWNMLAQASQDPVSGISKLV
ncbi:hypothetical protein FIBSPDRAFT_890856 [Athelia psychrophila]|uniref:Uncharacterized protein n=1 Tax=Athelia psychrophila TaxID=1759441 RepID=A0A166KFB1_9AGAM|nr:hypothetical protein FIBSPDRAFT_890856 [Fibularhizoctonia sp. CBS 109695]